MGETPKTALPYLCGSFFGIIYSLEIPNKSFQFANMRPKKVIISDQAAVVALES
jgi:hypothetical protein